MATKKHSSSSNNPAHGADPGIFAEQPIIADEMRQQIERYLYSISNAASAVRGLAIRLVDGQDFDGALGVSVRTLAEKIGTVSDMAIGLVNGNKPGCVGDFSEWAKLTVEKESEASAACE
jgi:hypothetical protein